MNDPPMQRRQSVSYVRPLLPPAAARQNIASYAHRYGVVVTRQGEPVGTMSAARFCRILRAAVENSTGRRRLRAVVLVRAIAEGLQGQGGPLCVPLLVLNFLRGMGRVRDGESVQ